VATIDHISVCVCTYKRPELLGQLLVKLADQKTDGLFDYSIVIVDNDQLESARSTAEHFAHRCRVASSYYVEPEQNIALARNMAVSHATGSLAAFIDDDESPIDEWLLRMYLALLKYRADGVFGPVKPLFVSAPPQWMIRAELFERPRYAKTGSRINWKQTGMGNVLVRRSVLDAVEGPFDRAFGSGGEDVDFFRRGIGLGKVFVWCGEAIVYEIVPAERTRLSFQLSRALLRGKASLATPSGRAVGILKSIVAFVLYTMLLPAFLLMGRHIFIKYLIKDFDHIGKLLALCGIDIVREKYVLK
jgi:succinoglycan biosynthesis protein ExoM